MRAGCIDGLRLIVDMTVAVASASHGEKWLGMDAARKRRGRKDEGMGVAGATRWTVVDELGVESTTASADATIALFGDARFKLAPAPDTP